MQAASADDCAASVKLNVVSISFLAHQVQILKLNADFRVLLQKNMSPVTYRELAVTITHVILPANEHQPDIEAQASLPNIINLAADTAVHLK